MAAWCVAQGVPLSVLRLQNVYGRGQAPGNPYTGVMTLFARLALAGESVPVYEDGAITRDAVHVTDVVSAIECACSRIPDGVRSLDIGSGQPVTILALAQMIAELAGSRAHDYRTVSTGDVRAAQCDTSDARRDLGWHPRMDLHDGLEDLLAWLRESG